MKKLFMLICISAIFPSIIGCDGSPSRPATHTVTKTDNGFMAGLQESQDWQNEAKLFDVHKATTAAIFAHATRVQTFRLVPTGNEKELGKVSDVPYFAQGPEQPPAFATKLGNIILDPKTYPFPGQSTKQCTIHPGVDFRVWRGRQFVDVILCFVCNQLAVMENNTTVPKTSIGGVLYGRCYVTGDFDSVRPKLSALAKEAMPGDTTIQSL